VSEELETSSGPEPDRKIPYQPALDGFRAIAVCLVLLDHFFLVPLGYLGVKAFFVLSGYLITLILLSTTSSPFPTFARVFYQRRAMRIFPLYYSYIAVLGVTYLLLHKPEGMAGNWPYLVSYTANFAPLDPQWRASAFFAHLWSLATEEQFYIVWPPVVWLMARTGGVRRVGAAAAVATVLLPVSHVLLVDAVDIDPVAAQWLPTRHFDALTGGALLACIPIRQIPHALRWTWGMALVVGSALVVAALVNTAPASAHFEPLGPLDAGLYHVSSTPLGNTGLNLVFIAAVVTCVLHQPTARALGRPVLVWMGKVSYGTYVLHYPLGILWQRAGWTHSLGFPFYLLAAFALAGASYYLLERPFLRMKRAYPTGSGSR
tara:strand:- start:473 stop:1597 length:1125 start_codon:yes stop_codon:yes gene_type:complete